MADYSKQTWVDDDGSGTVGTPMTKARMDHIEDGLKDAAEHHDVVTSLPTADSAHEHWILALQATGQIYYCDGSQWIPIGPPRTEAKWSPTRTAAGLVDRSVDGTTEAAPTDWVATKFNSGAGGVVGAVDLYLRADAAISGANGPSLQISLHADNAGVPATTSLLSSAVNLDPRGLTSAATPIVERISFSGTVTLAPATDYWLRIRKSNVTGGNYSYRLEGSSTATFATSSNGTTWSTTASKGLRFKLYLSSDRVVEMIADVATELLNLGSVDAGARAITARARSAAAVIDATNQHGIGVRGQSAGQAGIQGRSTYADGVLGSQNAGGVGPGVRGFGIAGPGVVGMSSSGNPLEARNSSNDVTPLWAVDGAGVMSKAAKGSVRNSYFHDAFRAVVSGVNPLADITGLTAFTAVKEYDLTIAGAVASGGTNRSIYLQPNQPNHNGGKHVVHRSYSSAGAPANDNNLSSLTGVDANGCFLGATDWNTDCEIFIFCRITLDGWSRYLYWEATYYNTSASNTDNMLMGRVSGIWYPANAPITEVSNFRIGLTGGTFSGGIRLRGYGT